MRGSRTTTKDRTDPSAKVERETDTTPAMPDSQSPHTCVTHLGPYTFFFSVRMPFQFTKHDFRKANLTSSSCSSFCSSVSRLLHCCILPCVAPRCYSRTRPCPIIFALTNSSNPLVRSLLPQKRRNPKASTVYATPAGETTHTPTASSTRSSRSVSPLLCSHWTYSSAHVFVRCCRLTFAAGLLNTGCRNLGKLVLRFSWSSPASCVARHPAQTDQALEFVVCPETCIWTCHVIDRGRDCGHVPRGLGHGNQVSHKHDLTSLEILCFRPQGVCSV